jgi:drug/metabolite transporter (DMT)-like permease
MGLGGAAWLMTGGTSGFGGGAGGYLLAVAAAVIWASYSLLTKRLGDFPTSAVALFCLASAALALLCHLLLEPRTAIATADVPYLIAVGLGPLGASFYFWDRAMKDGDPRVIGALAYLTPLLSTSLVAATGGGRLTAHAAIAGVLIVGGAVVGRR